MSYYPASAIAADIVVLPGGLYARSDDLPDTALRALAHGHRKRVVTWKRSTVTTFSAPSRRRMMRTMAAVDFAGLGIEPSFVTLTFRAVPADWLSIWNRWLREVRRRNVHYIWRIELQHRGAPHWHLIMWASADDLNALRDHWHRIAGHRDRYHKRYGWHQTSLDSYRRAIAYVSKYVAKVSPEEATAESLSSAEARILSGRRRWGTSRGLPARIVSTHRAEPHAWVQLKRLARRLRKAQHRATGYRARHQRFSLWLWVSPESSARALAWAGINGDGSPYIAEPADALRLAGCASLIPRSPPKPSIALCTLKSLCSGAATRPVQTALHLPTGAYS